MREPEQTRGFDDAYHPSPRPTFDRPTAIPRGRAQRHVWGDPESGEILDWIYVSSEKIHQLLFEIPVAGQFTHSDAHRTVFGADEVLYLVEGDVAVADPETGEVVRATAGEAVCFGPDTWHHCFNWGSRPARVLEFFAPPPAAGTSGAYAQKRPLLEQSRYRDDAVLGNHVPGGDPARGSRKLVVVRSSDYVWRLEGDSDPVLVGIIASTRQLTVATCEVRGVGWSGWRTHAGDASGYVLSGSLVLRVSGGSNRSWHELLAGDGFFIPQGAGYQVRNGSQDNAAYLLGAAPSYAGD
jgi:quercetin dioxygenase-like cupin family protein